MDDNAIKEIITKDNLKWMYSHLDTNTEVDEVVKYLKENNLTIYTNYIKGHLYEVILEGRDLSINGSCFSGKQLLNHVRNFRGYKAIYSSDEYSKYRGLLLKYEKVDKFFNVR